ncbi:MAG: hypothetical protein M3P44_11665 [Actinomycetota bacterium]|nr:hypothetical protein [Actinomycetota bacterium]
MGLLDDAIRDHLELKRRHGADPGEVARIENEALSAARREAAPAAAGVEEAVAEDDEVYDLEDDPLADRSYGDAGPDEAPEAEAPVHRKDPEPEAVYEHELEPDPQSTQQYSLEELEAQAARDEVAPGQPRPRAPESAEPPPAEPGEEDVLEETPEFLQETPEHDRLWFEQKPPKDFDF